MRNRPDSRPRLAGLRTGAAGTAPALDSADAEPASWQSAPWPSESAQSGSDPLRDDEEPVGWTPPPAEADQHHARSGRRREQAGPLRERSGGSRHVRRPARRPWGRLAKRWVPESLQDSRIDPGRRGALLLTVVAAVAALVAAVGVWWDRPEPRPVQAVSLAQVSQSPTPSTGHGGAARSATASTQGSMAARVLAAVSATTSAAPAVIVVSVTGAVRRPGLVRLPAGARVADAIDKAGGATGQADLTGLNLAQKLSDGASVVVADGVASTKGSRSSVSGAGAGADSAAADVAQPAGSGSDSPKGKVDLNTADVAALDALPGVGPVTAAGIVAWRTKNGRFTSVEQLQEIQGIGPAKYASLSPLVTV